MNDTMSFGYRIPAKVSLGGARFESPTTCGYSEWVERLIARTQRRATAERRQEVLALFQKALEWHRTAERHSK